jgi:hypothetical protein
MLTFGRYIGLLYPFATKATRIKNKYINAFQMELRTTYIRTTDGG